MDRVANWTKLGSLIFATLAALIYWSWYTSPLSAQVLASTLGLGLSAGILAVFLAVFLVRLAALSPRPGWWLIGLGVAAAMPLHLHVGAWDSVFGKLGWFTSWFGSPLMLSINRWVAAIWIHAAAGAPQVALIILGGLAMGRGIYEDQGLLDAPAASVFWRITFRRLLPFAALGLIWVMIVCAREIAATDIYQIGTLAEYIYLGYAMGQGMDLIVPWGTEARQLDVWFQIFAIGWTALLVVALTRRSLDTDWNLSRRGNGAVRDRGGAVSGAAGLLIGLMIFAMPLANLLIRASMTVQRFDGAPRQTLDPSNVFPLLWRCLRDYHWEFGWSLWIAVVGATLVVTTASILAFWAKESRAGRLLLHGMITLLLALPGPMIGALIFKLGAVSHHPWWSAAFDRTILAPVLASSLFAWPVIALIVFHVFRSQPRSSFELAALEGAGFWQRLLQIGLPMSWRVLLGIWGLAVVVVFGELSAAQMVQIAGVDTLPRLTLGFLHAGVDDKAAAVTLLTLLFVATVTGGTLAFMIPLSGPRRIADRH